MANIKKNFNFRNGVQVDDDNLLVTSTGLVGIGTTVPTEALDVRGNVKIIGDATITNATVGVLTLTEVAPTQIIGAGVSIKSGIVTAQGTGIVTFYGDARYLQNMPTSQWEDTNAGFAVSSIYNTGGTVGIATTNPQFTLQVGENPNQIGGVSGRGVGISSVGDIKASGIITASSFSGPFIGDITGNITGNISGGTVVSGIITAIGADINGDLDVDGHTNLDNVSVAGVSTFTGLLKANGQSSLNNVSVVGTTTFFPTGDYTRFFTEIDAQGGIVVGPVGYSTFNSSVLASAGATLNELNVTGVSTFGGIIEASAGQNKIPFLYSSMTDLPSAGSYHGAVAHVHATGSLYYAHAGNWWELVNKESDGRVGTGTEVYNIASINSSGIITAATELNSPLIGVGTDNPAHDIQVRKSGNVEVQVTSDTGSAGLTVGREPSSGKTNNAEFRYGLVSGGAPYSSAQSLDIVNYGTGNFNYHISANNPSGVDGDFHWHKGFNTRMMTLTGVGGSLGIGLTDPSQKLDVFGSAKISSSLDVGGNLAVTGTFTAGTLNATTINANLVGNATGNLTGLINSPNTGISTIPKLTSTGIGIGVTDQGFAVNINSNSNSKVIVTSDGRVGVGTTVFSASKVDVELKSDVYIHNSISVGNTSRSAVDFSDVVNIPDPLGNRPKVAYMIPPKVTTAQRDVFIDGQTGSATISSGALIYNTSTNTLQVYNGSSWGSLGSGGGGGEANQNAFSNVAVSGQSTVAADSTTDTLTLVAGSNVTLTTNAGNDTVTIAAANDNTQLSSEQVQDIVGAMFTGNTETNITATYQDSDGTIDLVVTGGGSGISNVVEDTTPQLGGNLDVQAREINTSTTNGNIKLNPNGTGVVEVRGAGGNDGTLQLNCSAQSHGIKLKSPPHSASASYTLTFPNNIVSGQFLKTDASGNLSWDSRLGAGFVNAADYGLDASATDGTNVTAINNAITALGTNGGTIFFPGGMFYLNATITLGASNNSIRFVGSGHQNFGGANDSGGTVLRKDVNNEFFNITNSRAIHFVGITFKGGAANQNGGNAGIAGGTGAITVTANAGCQGYLFENLVFHGIKNCLNFNGLSDTIIRGCRFRNPPLDTGTGAFITMDDNNYDDSTDPATGERLDQIRIENCIGDGYKGSGTGADELNNQVDGIHIKGFSNTIFVTNCSFIRLNRSYYIDNSWKGEFLYFQNAEAERASGQAGFLIDSGGNANQGNFITLDNCFASTCESHGIQLAGTLDGSVNITNCNVRDNKGHGILIDSDGGNTSIVNPVCAGNSKGSSGTNHGIFIGNDVDDVYIAGGRCGGDASVKGQGTQGRGILVNGATHSNIRIIGVNVTGNQNASEGIGASFGAGTSGNKISLNSGSTVSVNT